MDKKVYLELSLRRLRMSLSYLSANDRVIAQQRIREIEFELSNLYKEEQKNSSLFDVVDVRKSSNESVSENVVNEVKKEPDQEFLVDIANKVSRKILINFIQDNFESYPKELLKLSKTEMIRYVFNNGLIDKLQQIV